MIKNFGTFKSTDASTEEFVTPRDNKNSEGYRDCVPYLVMKKTQSICDFGSLLM